MNSENVKQKMKEYADILETLKKDGIIRTYNSPVGDYAEWLVSEKMNLIREKIVKKDMMQRIKMK